MLEMYIINNKTTGDIVETSRVDKVKDQVLIDQSDTSTTYSHIQDKIDSDSSLEINYYTNQEVPDPVLKKVNVTTKEIEDI